MKRIALVTVSAVVAGTIWFSMAGDKRESLLPFSTVIEGRAEQNTSDHSSSADNQTASKKSRTESQRYPFSN